jgi:hypothetical protein
LSGPTAANAAGVSGLERRLVGTGLLLAEGLMLCAAGVGTFIVGATVKLMPYDTDYLGASLLQLCKMHNCAIVGFIVHDRISFAGVIIALGILYVWLALVPLRQGQAWAWWCFAISGFTGIATFLTYLGYGYLDPVHAATSAELLLVLTVGLVLSYGGLEAPRGISTLAVPAERRATTTGVKVGTLLLLAAAAGLFVTGAAIMTIGATIVFVPTDVDFIGAQARELVSLNHRLVPVIAHDRASFGGALLASGLAIGFTVFAGLRSGERGLWWVLLVMGVIAFGATTVVHLAVGYTSYVHLLPSYVGAGLFALGLVLTRPLAYARNVGGR